MARPKNYSEKLQNIEKEIESTENKLRTLYDEKDELQIEMEMTEIQNIYKQMKDTGITVEQLFASVQKPKRPYNRKPKTEQKSAEA